jgi:flagellar biosynthesis GTPase FlhF
MPKKPEELAAEEAAKKKADEEAAAKKKADDDAAAAATKKDAEEGDEGKKKKSEKTFTKAELEAEKQKAIADAQKKWDDEKDLTELERYKKENEELKASTRMRDAKDEVVTALTAAGSNSPALAFEAIKGTLKFDEAGKLINSKDLIEGLKTSYPEQFGTPKTTETIDAGKGQLGGGDKLTKDKLAKMTPTEINALDWKEVSAVMAGE